MFVVGDLFPFFEKRKDCIYVYINFELLYNFGFFSSSFRAYRWIKRKYARFIKKVNIWDMVLDYHPKQYLYLRRNSSLRNVAVEYFPTNLVLPSINDVEFNSCSKKWDVCFVGAKSLRREKIKSALESKGISVSPYKGDLHEVMLNSRIVLNVHFQKCDNVETPRLIHAIAIGACLVTEYSSSLSDFVPDCYYNVFKYNQIVNGVEGVLANPRLIGALGCKARKYYENEYQPLSLTRWKAIIDKAIAISS